MKPLSLRPEVFQNRIISVCRKTAFKDFGSFEGKCGTHSLSFYISHNLGKIHTNKFLTKIHIKNIKTSLHNIYTHVFTFFHNISFGQPSSEANRSTKIDPAFIDCWSHHGADILGVRSGLPAVRDQNEAWNHGVGGDNTLR